MDIASLSVRRPVLALVMSVIIVLFGAIGYKFLGVREFPSIDPPVITVRTNYTGANAETPSTASRSFVPFPLHPTRDQVSLRLNLT